MGYDPLATESPLAIYFPTHQLLEYAQSQRHYLLIISGADEPWLSFSCFAISKTVLTQSTRMTEVEQPFRPREKLIEKQKFFQSIHKHTYLKGPMDKITSVAIPAALAATSLFLIGRGIYNMSHGIGKKE